MSKPRSPKEIKEAGEQELAMMAGILGVKLTGNFAMDRAAVDRALGVGGRVLGDTTLGEHPEGRASTLDELLTRYNLGGLQREGGEAIEPMSELPTQAWFTDEERQSYGCDGYHAGGSRYEFTYLWYQIVGEEYDLRGMPDWRIEHDGLRWEYPKGAVDHSLAEAALTEAARRYQELTDAVAAGYVPVEDIEEIVQEPGAPEIDFTVDDLWDLLGPEAK